MIMKKLKTMELDTERIMVEEYEEDCYLDINNLGKEIFIQPSLHEKYTRYTTNLTYERDELKLKLGHIRAILDLEIRNDPEAFDLTKIAEKAVTACIDLDPEVQDMTFDLLYLDKLVNEANGALRAITGKGVSLNNAVHLYKTGYWGELTAIPHKMQEQIDEYLDRNSMSTALEDNKRLKRRAKHGKKK